MSAIQIERNREIRDGIVSVLWHVKTVLVWVRWRIGSMMYWNCGIWRWRWQRQMLNWLPNVRMMIGIVRLVVRLATVVIVQCILQVTNVTYCDSVKLTPKINNFPSSTNVWISPETLDFWIFLSWWLWNRQFWPQHIKGPIHVTHSSSFTIAGCLFVILKCRKSIIESTTTTFGAYLVDPLSQNRSAYCGFDHVACVPESNRCNRILVAAQFSLVTFSHCPGSNGRYRCSIEATSVLCSLNKLNVVKEEYPIVPVSSSHWLDVLECRQCNCSELVDVMSRRLESVDWYHRARGSFLAPYFHPFRR